MIFISGSYDDAVAYVEAHRNVEPPVYNSSRLNESPIPLTAREIDSNDAFEETFNSEDTGSDEMNMVIHSDLLEQSTLSDHINTTNDSVTSDEIGNGNENSIENVSTENDREFAVSSNNSVDDESTNTEIESNLENDCNANRNESECDPLAIPTELGWW